MSQIHPMHKDTTEYLLCARHYVKTKKRIWKDYIKNIVLAPKEFIALCRRELKRMIGKKPTFTVRDEKYYHDDITKYNHSIECYLHNLGNTEEGV